MVPVREYRVTFWQHQLPPEGSDVKPEDMGWRAHHFDFGDVENVHEIVEWAEAHFLENTHDRSARGYVVGIWTPGDLLDEPTLLKVAGYDPTINDEPECNLRWLPKGFEPPELPG